MQNYGDAASHAGYTKWLDDSAELRGMLVDRRRLLRQLAHVLRRVGASHADRAKINKKRSMLRKQVRRALRANAEQIAAHCLEHLE